MGARSRKETEVRRAEVRRLRVRHRDRGELLAALNVWLDERHLTPIGRDTLDHDLVALRDAALTEHEAKSALDLFLDLAAEHEVEAGAVRRLLDAEVKKLDAYEAAIAAGPTDLDRALARARMPRPVPPAAGEPAPPTEPSDELVAAAYARRLRSMARPHALGVAALVRTLQAGREGLVQIGQEIGVLTRRALPERVGDGSQVINLFGGDVLADFGRALALRARRLAPPDPTMGGLVLDALPEPALAEAPAPPRPERERTR